MSSYPSGSPLSEYPEVHCSPMPIAFRDSSPSSVARAAISLLPLIAKQVFPDATALPPFLSPLHGSSFSAGLAPSSGAAASVSTANSASYPLLSRLIDAAARTSSALFAAVSFGSEAYAANSNGTGVGAGVAVGSGVTCVIVCVPADGSAPSTATSGLYVHPAASTTQTAAAARTHFPKESIRFSSFNDHSVISFFTQR